MKYANLGASPLKVSRVCLGAMMFGDQTDEAEAARIVAAAREQGVNFIDTADVYKLGESERITGRLISAERHHWVLASKLGNAMNSAPDAPNETRYSRKWMLRAIEGSLQRLNTDHLDIYYLHRDDNGMNLEEPLRALEQMLRDGKIRYWGVSNFRGWRIAEVVHGARTLGMPGPVVCQPYYNLLNRAPEVEVLPACRHHGIGVVPYSPIARGVLTGKYAPGTTPESAPAGTRIARRDGRMMQTEFREESLAIAHELKAHAESRGLTLTQWACAWVLAHRAVSAVIAGPKSLAQWQGYAGAEEIGWTDADEALADALVPPGHPSTPGFTDPAYPLEARRG
jgi:aryl-alcohol dehydrogenase-like predicted oxidoreductase